MRIFTLILNKVFKWVHKIEEQMAMGTIWNCQSSFTYYVFYILQGEGAEKSFHLIIFYSRKSLLPLDHFCLRVDVVLDCRLIRGGSMSMSFDDFAYSVVSV